jgi:CrcB protein
VASGGAAGAVARHAAGLLCTGLLGDRFPWGTLAVNVLGCFFLGWLAQSAASSTAISDTMKLTLGTGFLGAFTTFSTFGVQTIQVWNRSPALAIGNILANLVIGLVAAAVGMYLATVLASPQ